MPYTRVWIHAVWGTKNRNPYLTKEIRRDVIEHIKANAKQKQIYIKTINGYTDHLHCLFALNADTSIAKTLQLIKGESAFWINKNNITPIKFEWADEYYAGSVSESLLNKVIAYIDNQEEHHNIKSFEEEYAEIMRDFRIQDQG
jgi:putative transposase